MHAYSTLFLAAVIAIRGCASLELPANIKSFRDNVVKAGSCKNQLATGFYASNEGPNTFSYCGDHLDDYKIVYLQGTGGALADMDIDCDGIQKGPGDDGRCGSSGDTQSQTSFQGEVAGYGQGVKDLNAFVHPYIVFGNVGSKSGFKNYDPKKNDVNPLSLMAVVCGEKMFYGIWGDENGDDGPKAVIGEASISIATLCFGKDSINGNAGHDKTDVLYIAFTGKDAVPGKSAKWNAANVDEFSSSIKSLGDTLVQRIGGGSGAVTVADPTVSGKPASTAVPTTLKTIKSGGQATAKPTAQSTAAPEVSPVETPAEGPEEGSKDCAWTDHCAGATCTSENDCDGSLICTAGKCAA